MSEPRTPRGSFYARDLDGFRAQRRRAFAASWQWSGVEQKLDRDGAFAPSRPWADSDLEEPLLLWRDGECVRALSNVCTHRGVQARLYPGGRYAPTHEEGLRRFHALLARAMGDR